MTQIKGQEICLMADGKKTNRKLTSFFLWQALQAYPSSPPALKYPFISEERHTISGTAEEHMNFP